MSSNSNNKYQYPKCIHCEEHKTGPNWCKKCNSQHFKEQFGEWTSGNTDIDELIKQTQLEANDHNKVLEWISFKSQDIFCVGFLAEGGNGNVYKAKWRRGPIEYYDDDAQDWHRSGDIDIILKSIKDSKDVTREFFKEIELQMTSFKQFSYIIRCYGVTKIPDSENYMMIMDYKKDGSLREYLNKNFGGMKWEQKLNILYTTISGLRDIHNAKLMHGDFHSGNIIISGKFSYIADFGLCKSVNSEARDGVFGVVPYIAPEVLCRKKYSKEADIYSFGIIMNEVVSEKPPYNNISHDTDLMLQIVNEERRPEIDTNITPKPIIDLIKRCLSTNPKDRPDANKLFEKLSSFMPRENDIWTEFNASDAKMNSSMLLTEPSTEGSPSLDYTISNQAVYTSRHLTLPSLTELIIPSYLN